MFIYYAFKMDAGIIVPICIKENCPLYFPFPIKSHGKRNMRTKRPLHVFFIWCEISTKSTFCTIDTFRRLRELWEDEKTWWEQIDGNWDLEVRCQGTSLLFCSDSPAEPSIFAQNGHKKTFSQRLVMHKAFMNTEKMSNLCKSMGFIGTEGDYVQVS